MAQDENAGSASPSAMISRTVSKSNSAVYRADDWDLVTNAINNQVDWNTIEKKSLPQAYQNYSIEELKAIVQQKIEDRQRFQQKIKELGENRDTFVLEAKKNMANSSENTLEKALLDGVKKQIEERGCSFAVN
jgi:superfamily I DNA and RNA helicase